MVKLLRGGRLGLVARAGIDPGSDGLERARRLGVATTHAGLDGLRTMPGYGDVGIVFDATSAAAHARHAQVLAADGKRAIDPPPAAVGPYSTEERLGGQESVSPCNSRGWPYPSK